MDKLTGTLLSILGAIMLGLMSWTTFTTHKLCVNQAVLIERTKYLDYHNPYGQSDANLGDYVD